MRAGRPDWEGRDHGRRVGAGPAHAAGPSCAHRVPAAVPRGLPRRGRAARRARRPSPSTRRRSSRVHRPAASSSSSSGRPPQPRVGLEGAVRRAPAAGRQPQTSVAAGDEEVPERRRVRRRGRRRQPGGSSAITRLATPRAGGERWRDDDRSRPDRRRRAGPQGPEVGAFFDFDGTLIAATRPAPVPRAVRRFDVGPGELARTLVAGLDMSLRGADVTRLIEIGPRPGRAPRGRDRGAGRAAVRPADRRAWSTPRRASSSRRTTAPGTRSPSPPRRPSTRSTLARDVGIEHLLCTDVEVEDGVLTGRPRPARSCGARARPRACGASPSEHGVDLDASYAYGNGNEDIAYLRPSGGRARSTPGRLADQPPPSGLADPALRAAGAPGLDRWSAPAPRWPGWRGRRGRRRARPAQRAAAAPPRTSRSAPATDAALALAGVGRRRRARRTSGRRGPRVHLQPPELARRADRGKPAAPRHHRRRQEGGRARPASPVGLLAGRRLHRPEELQEGASALGPGRREDPRAAFRSPSRPRARARRRRGSALQEGRVPHRHAGRRADRPDRHPQRRRADVARLVVRAGTVDVAVLRPCRPRTGRSRISTEHIDAIRAAIRRHVRGAGRPAPADRRQGGRAADAPRCSPRRRIVGDDGRVARRGTRTTVLWARRAETAEEIATSTPTRATSATRALHRACARPPTSRRRSARRTS